MLCIGNEPDQTNQVQTEQPASTRLSIRDQIKPVEVTQQPAAQNNPSEAPTPTPLAPNQLSIRDQIKPVVKTQQPEALDNSSAAPNQLSIRDQIKPVAPAQQPATQNNPPEALAPTPLAPNQLSIRDQIKPATKNNTSAVPAPTPIAPNQLSIRNQIKPVVQNQTNAPATNQLSIRDQIKPAATTQPLNRSIITPPTPIAQSVTTQKIIPFSFLLKNFYTLKNQQNQTSQPALNAHAIKKANDDLITCRLISYFHKKLLELPFVGATITHTYNRLKKMDGIINPTDLFSIIALLCTTESIASLCATPDHDTLAYTSLYAIIKNANFKAITHVN